MRRRDGTHYTTDCRRAVIANLRQTSGHISLFKVRVCVRACRFRLGLLSFANSFFLCVRVCAGVTLVSFVAFVLGNDRSALCYFLPPPTSRTRSVWATPISGCCRRRLRRRWTTASALCVRVFLCVCSVVCYVLCAVLRTAFFFSRFRLFRFALTALVVARCSVA